MKNNAQVLKHMQKYLMGQILMRKEWINPWFKILSSQPSSINCFPHTSKREMGEEGLGDGINQNQSQTKTTKEVQCINVSPGKQPSRKWTVIKTLQN